MRITRLLQRKDVVLLIAWSIAAAAIGGTSRADELQQDNPIKVAGAVEAMNIVRKVNPFYPPNAKAECMQGPVMLTAIVAKSGHVENLQVVSGSPLLAESALEAVKQWIYQPYLLNGEPVEVETTVNVNFSIPNCVVTPNDSEGADVELPKKIKGPVTPPVMLYAPEPNFPPEARAARISGNVSVQFLIDEQGHPAHMQVVHGLGHGLDEKAVEAVKLYRFKPATADGKPVVVKMRIDVAFHL